MFTLPPFASRHNFTWSSPKDLRFSSGKAHRPLTGNVHWSFTAMMLEHLEAAGRFV
jgi:hypothetical protein